MIGYLEGEVVHRGTDVLTVLSGEVGYEVHVTPGVAQAHAVGSAVRLWCHLSVREQGWDLYGFLHKEERDLFRIVQKVPKIGARTAQAMLNVFDAAVLIRVVREEDVAALSTVPGIGKKTAQRVIVELQDLLNKLAAEAIPDRGSGRDGYESVQALLGLGYSATEAQARVAAALQAGVGADDVEAVIRHALANEGGAASTN